MTPDDHDCTEKFGCPGCHENVTAQWGRALARIRDLEAQLAVPLRCQRHPADCANGGVIRRDDPCPVCSSCADDDLRAARDAALEEAARVVERDFPSGDMGAAMRASYTAESIRALCNQFAARLYSMEEVEAAWLRARKKNDGFGLGDLEDALAALEGKKP